MFRNNRKAVRDFFGETIYEKGGFLDERGSRALH
jgi:hypothetical protein